MDQVHPLREATRITHRVPRGLERLERRRLTVSLPASAAVDPAEQTVVHEDGVVPAKERLPRPEGIALTGCVVVGVGDDHLDAVGRRRVGVPVRRRTWSRRVPAVLEHRVVIAWRDPLGPTPQQRPVDPGLVRHRKLHRHADRVCRNRAPPHNP